MPVKGVNTEKKCPFKNAIVLDGQQRITSLYYAIKTPDFPLARENKEEQNSYFYIDFSEFLKSDDTDKLIKDFYEKIEDEESFKKMLFPFYNLEHHYKWVNGLEIYLRKRGNLRSTKNSRLT